MKEKMVTMAAAEEMVKRAVAEALAQMAIAAPVTATVVAPVTAPVKTMTEAEFILKAIDKLHSEKFHGVHRVYDLTEPYKSAIAAGVIVGEKKGIKAVVDGLIADGKVVCHVKNTYIVQLKSRRDAWAVANGKATTETVKKLSAKAENSLKAIIG